MKRFLTFSTVIALVSLFSAAASAGFPKEAWLAPEQCTELVERNECEEYAGGTFDCSTTYESHEKRMEYLVAGLGYLEEQWPGDAEAF